jgi:UDP-sulfoquinovose synthase
MRMLVLGGDGYLGWPLSIKLAMRYPEHRVVIADNLDRRRLVEQAGGNSITPVGSPLERIAAFRRITGQENLEQVRLDVTTPALDALVERVRPTHIYHLAQQASAPWSMQGVEEAVHTLTNNEVGNMRLLWAMRQHVPDAHLIKLGTFGEYAKCGLDIPEGYFQPSWQGRTASRPAPFPRESDDIYHITKINDTNFISMACRKWGLRITDIMQSTIFGVSIEETRHHPELYTRLDYDAVFGTVANRFLTQVVAGHPMTVYGSGFQRTGLMALEDSLASMVALAERVPARGEHVVINHVTERDYCISELAEMIQRIAVAHGYDAEIHRGYDPRQETPPEKPDYRVETHYVSENLTATPLEKVMTETFEIVARYRSRIDPEAFPPRIHWCDR